MLSRFLKITPVIPSWEHVKQLRGCEVKSSLSLHLQSRLFLVWTLGLCPFVVFPVLSILAVRLVGWGRFTMVCMFFKNGIA